MYIKKLYILFIIEIFYSLSLPFAADARTVVKTAKELVALLSEDKEQGLILLDGDLFQIAGIDVKSGGKIKPFPGRRPVIIGFHQEATKGNRIVGDDGYWTVPIKSYGATQIVFLDDYLEPIPYACHINGQDGFNLQADRIETCNREERLVKVPIPKGYEFLTNREKCFFKNASVKLGYWFIGFELRQLYSDSYYIYGNVDNEYNYNLLSLRPYADVRFEFFNIPIAGDGIFWDGDDVLHIPAKYNKVRICTTPPIMNLTGERDISFEGITFTGANNDAINITGSNKHFVNCVFKNCGKGIVKGNSDLFNNCSVRSCLFENFYNNIAINLGGINGVVIEGNTFRHTGTLMKGGQVITVGGLDFKVINNIISDFSYNAISISKSRDYLPNTVTGIVCNNLIDNIENYGRPENQLDDGGGIYVIAHTDGVEISNNIVRNLGYEGCDMWGIYLDDGAYNCTIKRNLVYNMWPGEYAMTSRYVESCERSNINNIFEDNLFIGPCKIAGNRKGLGDKTIIRNNYIVGDLDTHGNEYVSLNGNKFVSATVKKDGKIVFGKEERVKKSGFTRRIKKLIKR